MVLMFLKEKHVGSIEARSFAYSTQREYTTKSDFRSLVLSKKCYCPVELIQRKVDK